MANRHSSLAVLAGLACLAACATVSSQTQVYESTEHTFRVVTVAEDLENPWSFAFTPDGDILVTERPGRLRIIRDGELLPNAVEGVPEVRAVAQGGLQEVALHPDFENNRIVYLSYSKPDGDRGTTALIRARFENDRLNDVEEIFEAKAWNGRGGHFGAKIAFDEDGYLFMSVGDRQVLPSGGLGDLQKHPAQDFTTHFGTIVRLMDDGSVPQDNPFAGHASALPEIWSYGHRNPQGLAFHPETGDLWSTEHGPQGGDELNVILPGRNYGWPVIGYGVNYRSGTPIHVSSEREGMEQPSTFWLPSIGASGLIVYDGDAFPEWRGNIFAGGLAATHRRLSRISVEDQRVMSRESLLHGVFRIRDVRQGADGFIYLAVDDRGGDLTDIVRLEPAD